MRKILFALLFLLLLSCTNKTTEYVLQANLVIVDDRDYAKYKYNKQKSKNSLDTRCLCLHYTAVNESNESIFVPIEHPVSNVLTVKIDSNNSMKIQLYSANGCYKKNDHGDDTRHYAPGDTIEIPLILNIASQNNTDKEWLQTTPTKELVSKIQIKMTKPTKGKNIDMIPDVVFNNDTSNININPVFVFKNNKAIVVYDNDSLVATVGDY